MNACATELAPAEAGFSPVGALFCSPATSSPGKLEMTGRVEALPALLGNRHLSIFSGRTYG